MNVIEVRELAKSFWIPSAKRETVREHVLHAFRRRSFERLDVLRSVSFDVKAGETVGIMGANGSGKSTLLKILAGIYRADSGLLHVGAPITPILGLGLGWNPELDAVDNVLLIGTAMGMRLRDARASVDEVLAFAGVERFAGMPLKHFSSGMAARLAYSVAFKAVRDVLVSWTRFLPSATRSSARAARPATGSCTPRGTLWSSSRTKTGSSRRSAIGRCCSKAGGSRSRAAAPASWRSTASD